jgi:hypothetical protein
VGANEPAKAADGLNDGGTEDTSLGCELDDGLGNIDDGLTLGLQVGYEVVGNRVVDGDDGCGVNTDNGTWVFSKLGEGVGIPVCVS